MGKLGAVIAQVCFAPMIKKGATHENPTPWIHGVMQIFALFMLLGMGTSWLVPESKRVRLEELAGEKEDVYKLQAGSWRDRLGVAGSAAGSRGSGAGDRRSGDAEVVESPTSVLQRGSGCSRSVDGTSERRLRDDDVEKKWWKVHAHAV